MAYMEVFGKHTQNNNDFIRYSSPPISFSQTADHLSIESFTASSTTSSITHSQTMSLTVSATTGKPAMPSPVATSPSHEPTTTTVVTKPPAIPPKSVRHRAVPTPPSSPRIVEEEERPNSSPTVIKITSPPTVSQHGEDYVHLCDTTSSQPSQSLSPVTPEQNHVEVVNNEDDDEQVVLRRNVPGGKV